MYVHVSAKFAADELATLRHLGMEIALLIAPQASFSDFFASPGNASVTYHMAEYIAACALSNADSRQFDYRATFVGLAVPRDKGRQSCEGPSISRRRPPSQSHQSPAGRQGGACQLPRKSTTARRLAIASWLEPRERGGLP